MVWSPAAELADCCFEDSAGPAAARGPFKVGAGASADPTYKHSYNEHTETQNMLHTRKHSFLNAIQLRNLLSCHRDIIKLIFVICIQICGGLC